MVHLGNNRFRSVELSTDRFHQLRVFVAVAETGGFAKAASALHSSPPAVTRAVADLEDRLGVRLLNRTTRTVHLTQTGARSWRMPGACWATSTAPSTT